ncbi:MAG: acyl-CoA/acyl-ACP dehydrogenase [Chloroflexi bacterium]|nr:acyl-CoA/acyl-ACP dehydrogenase [Chloroflexota bacterium]
MLTDIEAELTGQERAVRDAAHKFALEVMRPAAKQLDALADPADVIAPNSILWDVFKKHKAAGLNDIEASTAELTALQRARIRALYSEEMGWGDSGLAISLGVANFHKTFVMMSGRPSLVDRYLKSSSAGDEIGCWAVTEPDHGSDQLGFTEPHFTDPSVRGNCIATRDGDDYVIRGQKSAWVSNGTIATVAALFCQVDPSEGLRSGGVAVVPLDLPGVSRGKPTDKLGQRPLNQGEIFFDEVRIPAEYMVVGKENYQNIVQMILTGANASMGQMFVGLGRASLEHAIGYAAERTQGGRPINQHQSVKSRLFKMFMQVEAARALARRVAYYNATNPPLLQYSIASKVFCTQTAFDVSSEAVQIFGGVGLTKEFPVEKLMRDARASMIEDGCNEILGLVGAALL